MVKKRSLKTSEEFSLYMDIICKHENYASLPNKTANDGTITWVIPSPKERNEWWDLKVKNMRLKNRAEVARAIHPKELKGFKPCSVCGKKLNINYVYPNKYLLKKINICSKIKFNSYDLTIHEILYNLYECNEGHEKFLSEMLGLSQGASKEEIEVKLENFLTPGVMSNAGDRLDGFHTYNACCRKLRDKGRNDDNMSLYSVDRRAYEYWADGNDELASTIMAEYRNLKVLTTCNKCKKDKKVSGDHVGPISLGFSLDNNFIPLCKECNSQKNNRLSESDFKNIITRYHNNEKVVNWYMKPVWERIMNLNLTDLELIREKMRINVYIFYNIFYKLKNLKELELIEQYINNDFLDKKYVFSNFDPNNITNPTIILRNQTYVKQKIKRKRRIALSSLDEFQIKENRNISIKINDKVEVLIDKYLDLISKEKILNKKKNMLDKFFEEVATILFEDL